MSNELLNYHICDGEPQGPGATLDEIADYYGELLFEIRPKHRRGDIKTFGSAEDAMKFINSMEGK